MRPMTAGVRRNINGSPERRPPQYQNQDDFENEKRIQEMRYEKQIDDKLRFVTENDPDIWVRDDPRAYFQQGQMYHQDIQEAEREYQDRLQSGGPRGDYQQYPYDEEEEDVQESEDIKTQAPRKVYQEAGAQGLFYNTRVLF